MTPVFNPRQNQQDMLDFRPPGRRKAWWATPGAGKTAAALLHVELSLHDSFSTSKWLIVAPPLVALDQWVREAGKWRNLQHLRPRYISAADLGLEPGVTVVDLDTGWERQCKYSELTTEELTVKERYKIKKGALVFANRPATKKHLLSMKEELHVVPYHLLHHVNKALGVTKVYDGLIFDESTFIKNKMADTFRAARDLAWADPVEELIELTGSPQPNGANDLFGQMYLLDQGKRMGRTLKDWRADWCMPATMSKAGRVWTWKLRPDKQDEFRRRVAEVAITIDHNIGIPLVETEKFVKLNDKAREVYDDLEKKWIHIFETGGDVTAGSGGVLRNKLMQTAQGAVFDEDRIIRIFDDTKLDALEELIDECDSPILLGYKYKPDFMRIKKRFGFAVEAREHGALDAFRAGKLKLLTAHPSSMSHGIDGLQGRGWHIVWFGVTDNLEHYDQLNKRLHRPGQDNDTVYVHRIIAEDTIEEDLAFVVLPRKKTDEDAMKDAARRRRG